MCFIRKDFGRRFECAFERGNAAFARAKGSCGGFEGIWLGGANVAFTGANAGLAPANAALPGGNAALGGESEGGNGGSGAFADDRPGIAFSFQGANEKARHGRAFSEPEEERQFFPLFSEYQFTLKIPPNFWAV